MSTKILIIDDNKDLLFTMRAALELRLYTVNVWESFLGCAAVAKIAPSAVFLDFTLGKDYGTDVIRQLRAFSPTRKLPVFIVSGWDELRELARNAGADDYLPKPFSLEELWQKAARFAI